MCCRSSASFRRCARLLKPASGWIGLGLSVSGCAPFTATGCTGFGADLQVQPCLPFSCPDQDERGQTITMILRVPTRLRANAIATGLRWVDPLVSCRCPARCSGRVDGGFRSVAVGRRRPEPASFIASYPDSRRRSGQRSATRARDRASCEAAGCCVRVPGATDDTQKSVSIDGMLKTS